MGRMEMEENILEAEAAAKLLGNSLVVWARGAISSFKETVTSFRVFANTEKKNHLGFVTLFRLRGKWNR